MLYRIPTEYSKPLFDDSQNLPKLPQLDQILSDRSAYLSKKTYKYVRDWHINIYWSTGDWHCAYVLLYGPRILEIDETPKDSEPIVAWNVVRL